MALGTPVEIARGHTSAAQASLAVTLATAVSAGDLIVVVAVNHNTGTVVANSCVDSVGANTYTRITVANAGGSSALLAYCGNAAALQHGSPIGAIIGGTLLHRDHTYD